MMLRVRFHGRGGQGAKTASRILGDAAFNDGYYSQDFPIYGAERRGAPVAAFTRFSDGEITERGFIFSPDIVGVMDDSLIDDPLANPFAGLRKGGCAVVNTTKRSDALLADRKDATIIAVDLTGMALKMLGKAVLSSGIAAAVARVAGIGESQFLAAVAEELREVGLSEEMVRKNVELAMAVYGQLAPLELRTEELPTKLELVPLAVVVSGEGMEDVTRTGNSAVRHTGNWRTFKPVIDYEKCTDCMICYAYCPESAMSVREDGRVAIDYDNCKGCMICLTECPLRAISQTMEGGTR
ncbi:MAG: 2-oxoacid:acceptor oxidoreductase family protein [Thaumarchaeota archaeon]|nr:2-oxoacid:acceptor oxidoreductase family protein [Rhodospirillales bacterium]MDE1857552.1 2-oxoacid:acceptor oxidoreductase family protein [Nitrososphaerota archaeon]